MKISHKTRVFLTVLLVIALCMSIVPVVAMAAQSTRTGSDIEYPSNTSGGSAEEEEGDIRIPIGSLPTVPEETEPTVPEETEPSEPETVPGDLNGDDRVSNEDVVKLLWHTLFPEEFPLDVSGDLNGDDKVSNEDVVKLLWHTLFPDEFPL